MKEEQFEPIDLKMRQAAEQVEPEFDEVAWQRMEILLDKRKKLRLPFIWWLTDVFILGALLLLVVGGAKNMGAVTNKDDTRNDKSTLVKTTEKNSDDETTIATNKLDITTEKITGNNANDLNTTTEINQVRIEKNTKNNFSKEEIKSRDDLNRNSAKGQFVSKEKKVYRNRNSTDKKVSLIDAEIPAANSEESALEIENVANQNSEKKNNVLQSNATLKMPELPINTGDTISALQKQNAINSAEAEVKNSKNSESVSQKSFRKSIYLFGAAMPGFTFVSGSKPGQLTTNFGGGVGFAFAKKWTVQAGAFVGSSIYTAGPGDYKTKPGSYYSYWDIKNVNADCNIIQIPLQLQYNILQKKNTTLFASGGFTTMIMQKEIYNYYYYRNGNPYNYTHTYASGNVEWMSHATIAAGIKQSIGKRVFAMASPYYNLPIQGVGEGSIKLHSFGLQLGIGYEIINFKK